MKTIEEMIAYYISKGMTSDQAENYTCQEIILNKISKQSFLWEWFFISKYKHKNVIII